MVSGLLIRQQLLRNSSTCVQYKYVAVGVYMAFYIGIRNVINSKQQLGAISRKQILALLCDVDLILI